MCGRYALAVEHELLRIRFGFGPSSSTITPRYNIAPTQQNPVIIGGQQKELKPMRWGLIPHWAKDETIGNKLINARAETVHEKPSFRDAFKKSRCIVPATGFFEWRKQQDSKSKQPYYIFLADNELFAFAGLWSWWKSGDKEILTYTIITTEANEFMKDIHHRMPVILKQDHEEAWLDPELDDPQELKTLLQPIQSEVMDAYEVARVVNSPRNDTHECIARL
jgi:putative SOS response-associated peptidase YedK